MSSGTTGPGDKLSEVLKREIEEFGHFILDKSLPVELQWP